MIKTEELSNPASCMSRARDDEMTFVLLGRDLAAPVAIRAWIAERLLLGKNQPQDAQIVEARACAATMEGAPTTRQIRITGNRVLIKPDAEEARTAGGLYIPDAAKHPAVRGTILAVGPGSHTEGGIWMETMQELQPGVRVMYGKFSGSELPQGLLLSETEILAIVD